MSPAPVGTGGSDAGHLVPFRPDRWVAGRERPRAKANRWERIGDLYLAVLAVLTLGAMAFGLVAGTTVVLGHPLSSAPRAGHGLLGDVPRFGAERLTALVAVVLSASVVRVAAVLGPVCVDRAQAVWWLSLPVPAAPYLWRGLLLRVLGCAGIGTLGGVTLAGGIAAVQSQDGAVVSAPAVAGVALGVGALGALLPSLAALAQATGRRDLLRRGASAAPLLGLVLLFPGLPLPPLPALVDAPAADAVPLLLLAAGAAALTVLCLALARARLERIPHTDLAAAGGASAHAGAAMFLLNVRDLAAALAEEGPRAACSRRRSRLLTGSRPGGPVPAAVRADLVVLARTPGLARRLLTGVAVVVVTGLSEPGRSPLVLGAAVLIAGLIAARAVRSAAEGIGDVPELARLIPLEHGTSWSVHTLAPAAFLVPWAAAVGVLTGLFAGLDPAAGTSPSWVPAAVGACAGFGLAGAAVRLGTQPEMDWGAVMQGAQTGRAVGPVASGLSHGTDMALLAALPLAVLPLLAAPTQGYVVVAAIVALLAWGVGRHVAQPH